VIATSIRIIVALLTLARFNPELHRRLLVHCLNKCGAMLTQCHITAHFDMINTEGFGGGSSDHLLSTRLDCVGHLAFCL